MNEEEQKGRQARPAGGGQLRLIDSCITQLKAQGPSRTCNESKEGKEEEEVGVRTVPGAGGYGEQIFLMHLRHELPPEIST